MKIIKPYVGEMYNQNPQKHIESIGRICYKSEDKVTDDSNIGFIRRIYNNKHWAILEHFRFIMEVPATIYTNILEINSPYINNTMVRADGGERMIISASARGLLDALQYVEHDMSINGHTIFNYSHIVTLLAVMKHLVWVYGCSELFDQPPCQQYTIGVIDVHDMCEYTYIERMIHEWHSVRFVCDRGVSHELVRHRKASFAQESTRYCNYSNGKFGNELTVIDPLFFDDAGSYELWKESMHSAEETYMRLINCGATPQEARTVLPNSIKTDIVVTATNKEWKHIIDLRFTGTTGKPHPQMSEVMNMMITNNKWAVGLCQQ